MKNVNEHIERLIRYLNGEIGNKEAKALRSEMADDTELADLLEVVKNLLQQGQTFKTMSLGKASKQLSRQIFKDFKRSQKARKSNYGINIFDSKILPIAQGVRPATVDTRRLKYRFEACELEISLYPVTPESYELIGQITGIEPGKELKITLTGKGANLTAESDRFYLFRFARVPSDKYRLQITDKSKTVGRIDIEI